MLSLTETDQDNKVTAEADNLQELAQNSVADETPDNAPPQSAQVEDDIPEKLRGKSVAEIARMYQEAEKQIGRQGNELGQHRKQLEQYQQILDTYIQGNTVNTQQSVETETDDEVDFFVDPDTAVAKRIKKELESNPDIKAAREMTQHVTRQAALAALEKNHPDWKNLVQNSDFANWIQGSQFRLELAKKADQYDYEAANELFSLYKERAGYQQQTQAEQVVERRQDVQRAATGSAKGTGESRGKRVYRRSDIRELMIKDPNRYRQLEPEIRQAYAEGRVV